MVVVDRDPLVAGVVAAVEEDEDPSEDDTDVAIVVAAVEEDEGSSENERLDVVEFDTVSIVRELESACAKLKTASPVHNN